MGTSENRACHSDSNLALNISTDEAFWKVVPTLDYSNTESMLAKAGVPSLRVNFQRMTENPFFEDQDV